MMSTFFKSGLKISLFSLAFGAVLLGAGYATGGVQAIQEITAPSKQTETFKDISDLHLDTYRYVTVQAGNVDETVVAYSSGSKFIADVRVTKEGKHYPSKVSNKSQLSPELSDYWAIC